MRRVCRRAGLLLPALMASGALWAQGTVQPEAGVQAPSPSRPRIGLVLGGGGAKGAAHIGVLEVLDELRVPVDCVAATSMGALVGGIFASGTAPDDIERSVLGIDWSQTVGGVGQRDRTPIERKLQQMSYTNSLEIGISKGGVSGPGGLLATQDIESLIWRLVSRAQFTQDFDKLPIPFRAVATDMLSGKMVVLDSGDLSVAMRASMAIPGAFAPVNLDGKLLADGGMVRNLPVDVARDLCADVVIAVWLTTPEPTAQDLDSAFSVISRSLDLMVTANERTQIATLTDDDVGIQVDMGDIETGDFDRVGDAVTLGREAARQHRDALLRYALPEDQYLAWQKRTRSDQDKTYRLAGVQVVGTRRVNPDFVRAQLDDAEPGTDLTPTKITAYAERVYALGDFERVDYRLTGAGNDKTLEIHPVEKSWGPNFLRFDLGLATTGDGDLRAVLRAEHERTWLNGYGGRWHNAVQVGQQTLLTTDFYQPIDVRQHFFVQPILQYGDDLEDLYYDGDRVARYFLSELYGQFDFGVNFGTRAQLRFGLRHGWEQARFDTGLPGLPELPRQADTALQYRFIYDTRDSVALPTKGSFFNARYMESRQWLGGELDYGLWEAVLAQAFDFRGNSLNLIFGAGNTLRGEPPVNRKFQLGGIRTFPGLRPGELRGNEYWYVGTSYAWRVTDLLPVLGQALYAGLRLQAGEVNQRVDDIDDGPLFGISGNLSGRTPVGAFILSLAWLDTDVWRLQFSVGQPLDEGSLLDELQ
jgi:NTE family protein